MQADCSVGERVQEDKKERFGPTTPHDSLIRHELSKWSTNDDAVHRQVRALGSCEKAEDHVTHPRTFTAMYHAWIRSRHTPVHAPAVVYYMQGLIIINDQRRSTPIQKSYRSCFILLSLVMYIYQEARPRWVRSS